MDELLSANTQEVATPETVTEKTVDSLTEETTTAEIESENTVEVADQHEEEIVEEKEEPKRDFQKDAAYAEMRRKSEQAEKERDRLIEALRVYGHKAENVNELAASAMADASGRPLDEVKAELESQDKVKELEDTLSEYKQKDAERTLSDDLNLLKQHHAELKDAKDIYSLGEDFIRLRAMNVDPLVAYEAVKQAKSKTVPEKPKSTGSMKSSTPPAEKEFYTSEEVDNLTSTQLDDPKIWDRVMKSMSKWGKKG